MKPRTLLLVGLSLVLPALFLALRPVPVAPAWETASLPLVPTTRRVASPLPPQPKVAVRRGSAGRASLGAALASYEDWARYPPDCRPLNEGMVDILRPDSPIPGTTPLDRAGRFVATLSTASRRIIPGARIVPELSVQRLGVPVEVRDVRFELPQRDPVRDGVAVVTARFVYAADDGWTEGRAAVTLLAQSSVPLRFTGALSDAVSAGHLVVSAGVEVAQPGRYILHAVMRDADDRPLAYATFDGALATDDAVVPFRFFGRLLRDHGGGGPYRVTLAWGGLYRSGQVPERLAVATWRGVHETAAYAATAFSDAEWDAPEKRRRLRMLAALHRAAP